MDKQNNFSPATLNQLITVRASQILAKAIPEISGLVSVTGRMSDPGRPRGNWYYGVLISADGGRILADIPSSLISGRQLRAGQPVRLTGVIRVRAGHSGTIDLRLEVSEAEHANTNQDAHKVIPEALATADEVSSIQNSRHPFPVTSGALDVTLIHSGSLHAQVAEDCLGEINKLGSLVNVDRVMINMLDPVAISGAIAGTRGKVLVMIRGGGESTDFEIFNDRRVLEAMAACPAYRVIGLGHSGNHTLLDKIADHAARTPAQAGLHVREAVQQVIAQWRAQKASHVAVSPSTQEKHRWQKTNWWALGIGLSAAIAATATALTG